MCREMEYEYWMARIQHLSNHKKYLLRLHLESAKKLYYIEEMQIAGLPFLNEKERNTIRQAQREKDIRRAYEEMTGKGIRFVPWFSSEYPAALKEISDFPYALYVKGKLPDEMSRRIAIVGARSCLLYTSRCV